MQPRDRSTRARTLGATIALTAALAFAMTGGLGAQGISQQQADEILKELRAIRQLLQRMVQQPPPAAAQPAAPPADEKVTLANVGGFMLGRPDAPLTLVEFTDLQCPFCSRFSSTTFDQIKKTYIDTGKVRFISKDFPLDMHPEAMRAARACRCAADQKKFWEMRSVLLRNASKLSPDFIVSSAAVHRAPCDRWRSRVRQSSEC